MGILLLGSPQSGPTGLVILNGFNSVANGDYPYKNLLLGAPTPHNPPGSTGDFPAWLDNNGYPLPNPSSRSNNVFCDQVPVPPSWTGNYILGWTGKANFTLDRGAPGFTIVSGGSFVSGGTGFSITAVGTNGRIVFTPTTSTISVISFYFNTSVAGAFDGTLSGAYLCRDNGTDEADILSGDLSRMFNNDFISAVSALKPYAIRVMDFVSTNNSCQTQPWTLRRPLTSFSFGSSGSYSNYPPSCWAGAIAGTTDTFTCSAASGTPIAWTHGETFQAQFGSSATNTVYNFTAAADNGSGLIRLLVPGGAAGLTTGKKVNVQGNFDDNTKGCWVITVIDSTHVDLATNAKTGQPSVFAKNTSGAFSIATIDCGSRGAKLLAWGTNAGGAPLIPGNPGGVIVGDAICTFHYDADLDVVMYTPAILISSGISSGPPIEVLVAFANKLNCGLWYTFPHTVVQSATYPEVASITSYVSANLKFWLDGFFEYSNEIWNTMFGQTGYANLKGIALGLHEPSSEAMYSYYGLRVAQLMPVVKTAWGGRAGLHTVLANQAFAVPLYSAAPVPTYRFNGASLTPTGNAVYAASSISGGVDYSVEGVRPIDVCTDPSYATYFFGAQFVNADSNYSSLAGITGSTNLLGQAANYVAGGSTNIANALAFVDNDIRAGVGGGQTLLSLDTNIYPAWEALLASYDTWRVENGLPKLALTCYEGGCEVWPVTPTQLQGLGAPASTIFTSTGSGTFIGTVAGGHGLSIGSGVIFNSNNQLPAGILSGVIYYVVTANFTTTTFSISTTPGGAAMATTSAGSGTLVVSLEAANVRALLTGYKNSPLFKQLVLDQFSQMMGTFAGSPNFGLLPHSKHPNWYQFGGGSQWALGTGDLYSGVWQSYAAFQQYNGG